MFPATLVNSSAATRPTLKLRENGSVDSTQPSGNRRRGCFARSSSRARSRGSRRRHWRHRRDRKLLAGLGHLRFGHAHRQLLHAHRLFLYPQLEVFGLRTPFRAASFPSRGLWFSLRALHSSSFHVSCVCGFGAGCGVGRWRLCEGRALQPAPAKRSVKMSGS